MWASGIVNNGIMDDKTEFPMHGVIAVRIHKIVPHFHETLYTFKDKHTNSIDSNF